MQDWSLLPTAAVGSVAGSALHWLCFVAVHGRRRLDGHLAVSPAVAADTRACTLRLASLAVGRTVQPAAVEAAAAQEAGHSIHSDRQEELAAVPPPPPGRHSAWELETRHTGPCEPARFDLRSEADDPAHIQKERAQRTAAAAAAAAAEAPSGELTDRRPSSTRMAVLHDPGTAVDRLQLVVRLGSCKDSATGAQEQCCTDSRPRDVLGDEVSAVDSWRGRRKVVVPAAAAVVVAAAAGAEHCQLSSYSLRPSDRASPSQWHPERYPKELCCAGALATVALKASQSWVGPSLAQRLWETELRVAASVDAAAVVAAGWVETKAEDLGFDL